MDQSSEPNDTELMNQILEEQKDGTSPTKPQNLAENSFKSGKLTHAIYQFLELSSDVFSMSVFLN